MRGNGSHATQPVFFLLEPKIIICHHTYWCALIYQNFKTLVAQYFFYISDGDEKYANSEYFINRWKKFWPKECRGEWRHAVCIFNLEDMKPLFEVDSPYLFVNKFVMHINADVLDITEAWFYSRQDFTYRHQNISLMNLDFYANLPQVKYQATKRRSSQSNAIENED